MGTPDQPGRGPSGRPRASLVLGRRAALAGLVGGGVATGALLAGCRAGSTGDTGPTSPGAGPSDGLATSSAGADPSETPSSEPTDGSSALETGDRTRVRMALDKTEAMLAGVLALRQTPVTRGLVSLHTAHRTTLRALLDVDTSPTPSAPPPLTRAELPLREAGLQAELVAASLAAEDGLVARLLASMSAGVAQQLAALPVGGPPRPGTEPSPSGAEA